MDFKELWYLFTTINIVTVVTFLLTIIAIAHMLSQRHKPSSMIAWFVIILLMPYIGIPLYVTFSGRKIDKIIKSKRQIELKKIYEVSKKSLNSPIERLLRANAIAGAIEDNSIYLCKDGVEAYYKLMQLINEAKSSIYITTYILENDYVTKNIIKALTKKAKEGVDVKLLIDSIGSLKLELFPFILKPLKEAGGEYQFFMSIIKKPLSSKLNLRNHRKMIIIDNKKVMSGGMNIAKEYMAPSFHPKLWVDLSFILTGKAALHYYEVFKYDWEFETNTTLSPIKVSYKKEGDSIVQVVPSGPDVERDALYEAILAAIFEAKEKVWILSPYFIPDDSLLDALIVAKHKGVDVKIITAKISDHIFVDIAKKGYLRDLYKEGVEILFFKSKMIHAKAILIDKSIAVMGSSNFDIRSFFYNFEIVSFCYTQEDINNLKKWIEQLFTQCDKGMPNSNKLGILIENIFKLMAPAL